MSLSELNLNLGGATMNCTNDEIAAALAAHLHEIRSVVRLLRPDERVALRMIMARPSGTLRVGDVFREFARESEAHKTLRRLRAAQFVRPAETGRWDPDERIELKPFARLLWDRLGEGEIFATDSDEVVLVPDEQPVVEEVAEPKRAAANVWEDDAVVDLGDVSDVDEFQHYVEEELRQNP